MPAETVPIVEVDVPEAIVHAARLRDAVDYLRKQGLQTAEEILAEIERCKPYSEKLKHAEDIENRVRRILAKEPAPPSPSPTPTPAPQPVLGASYETTYGRGWDGTPGEAMQFEDADPRALEAMGYKIHAAAALLPLMADPELAELTADIKKNGQRLPITRNWDGVILDGRNRIIACRRAGVEPKYVTFEEGSEAEVGYIISVNIPRRHLTVKQRCKLAVRFIPLFEAEAKKRQKGGQGGVLLSANLREASGKATEKAAAMFKVSPRSVESALKVERDGVPELKQAVELTVSKAAKIAALPPDEQRAALAAKEFPPPPTKPVDYAALKRATATLGNGLEFVKTSEPQFAEIDTDLAARVGKAIKVLTGVLEQAKSTVEQQPEKSQPMEQEPDKEE